MGQPSISSKALNDYLNKYLDITRFKDYCPNGLQVEGRSEIRHVVTGVTASMALIERAIELEADAILVHHGYFWRGEDARVLGQKQRRLKALLTHDINLMAYHLPLDMHPEVGNNARLGAVLALTEVARFGDDRLGWIGTCEAEGVRTIGDFRQWVAQALGREPQLIGEPSTPLSSVAWCTGAAQGMFEHAINAGASIYVSGEISEPTVHLARESGIAYLACGHHATERYGIEALGQHIERELGVRHTFVDIPNPV